MARRSSKKVTREMFVRTRWAWRARADKHAPFVCIQIAFTSVNGKKSTDYTVTLWLDGEHIDTCDCTGFTRYGRCCHLEHFRLVKQLRAAMTTPAPQVVPSLKAVLIESLLFQLNSKTGKPVVMVDASSTPVTVKEWDQITPEEHRRLEWERKERLANSLDFAA